MALHKRLRAYGGDQRFSQFEQLVAQKLSRLGVDRLHGGGEGVVLLGVERDDLAALGLDRGLGVLLLLDVQLALEGDGFRDRASASPP